MATVLPALNADGWITDPLKQLDLLFAHALETDFSQSNTFHGRVTSIPFIIAIHQANPDNLVRELKQSLTVYFSRYFDSVTVNSSVGPDIEGTNQYPLFIEATVSKNGSLYNLSNIVTVENGKIANVLREVNK